MNIQGIVRKDKKTKNLLKRLKPGNIALIDHLDLDTISAHSLIEKKVRGIINVSSSISGKYPNMGPFYLLKEGIVLLDEVGEEVYKRLKEQDIIEIRENIIYKNGNVIGKGRLLTTDLIEDKLIEAKKNLSTALEKFAENTLEYIKKEKHILIEEPPFHNLGIEFKGKHVLVVVRGENYKVDLKALRSYIGEFKPILLGVDGGADALLEFGYKPDIIIGDMDSISDTALTCGAKILVHAYTNGEAPGVRRVEKLGLNYQLLPIPGTSEDVALLLADSLGADLIVGVGMHFSLIEFLEKGRSGMASTFLVRLKVGSKLFDAKGVSKIYRQRVKFSLILGLILAGLVPFFAIFFASPVAQTYFRLIQILIKKNLGW